MQQNCFHSPLGPDLRLSRKAAKLTQASLAGRVGLSLPTLRAAERGQGAIGTYVRLAAAVGIEVGGRSLPPGDSLGARVETLRTRRSLGRRVVAEMASVSPTTLAALEKRSLGHLSTLSRVGEALGAQLRLVPTGSSTPFWTSVAASSVHEGWTTPRDVLDRLYEVVGGPSAWTPARRFGRVRKRR